MKKGILLLAISLLVSCGKKTNPLNRVISAATKKNIEQNLAAGRIPSPMSIAENDVAVVPDPCVEFKENLPKDWQQGYLDVPEIPGDTEGRKIKIFYYGKINPEHTPVVFFNGGPGSPSFSSYNTLRKKKWMMDTGNIISFIFMDQRGNGCSDIYPQGKSVDVLERLRYYGTRGIVADAEALRKHLLGDKPWNIFGQSYGAFIVHRYLTIEPKLIKTAFAHGNAINADSMSRLKMRIKSQVRVWEEYLKQFPDDRKILKKLLKDLTSELCMQYEDEGRKTEACGSEVMQLTADYLGFTQYWIDVHQWLNIIVKNNELDIDALQFYLDNIVGGTSGNPLNVKITASKVIGKVDRNIASTNTDNCTKVKESLLMEGIKLNEYFTECTNGLNFNYNSTPNPDIENLKKDHLTLADFSASLKQNSQVNFYLYSGQKDPYVPVETYQEELAVIKNFPNLFYTNFTGTGHDGYSTEPKVWQDLIKESK